jgi:hypothetical protein
LAGTWTLIEVVNKTVLAFGATYYWISVTVAFSFSAAIYLYRKLRGYRLKSKGHYISSIFLIAGATGLPMIITIFPPAAGITSNVLLSNILTIGSFIIILSCGFGGTKETRYTCFQIDKMEN